MTISDPLEMFRLDDQVALVTGASAGLGARFARVLHSAGATVVIRPTASARNQRLSTMWHMPRTRFIRRIPMLLTPAFALQETTSRTTGLCVWLISGSPSM